MLFSSILKKFSEWAAKRKLLTEMILGLKIDDQHKQLFLDSLDVLDTVWLESLYTKITVFVQEIEEKEMTKKVGNIKQHQEALSRHENEEKEKETNTFNFLLDSI
jgi:hypothetical protein